VWGKSWEQVVVDATLWRTAPAVIWYRCDITPAAIDLSFLCGPGILLKRHSPFITHPIRTNIAALLCTSTFLKDSDLPLRIGPDIS
jgi:hypothetical protein